MGFQQIQKQSLEEPITIKSKYPDVKFTYYSDIVYQTEQVELTIAKVEQNEDEYIYHLDMRQFCQNNQRVLNNFSVIKSQYETIVCLLVYEQNKFSIVFP